MSDTLSTPTKSEKLLTFDFGVDDPFGNADWLRFLDSEDEGDEPAPVKDKDMESR